tara:strand:+ start:370 stop:498 length:129 start_codon:yes stop_codon:yes gene_type:complete
MRSLIPSLPVDVVLSVVPDEKEKLEDGRKNLWRFDGFVVAHL